MSLMWTEQTTEARTETPVTPNNAELLEMTRSMVLVGYLFVALGGAAVGVALAIVAIVIAGTW